ncbi:hypothetical protein E4V01_24215 [Methylorubrum sp. Q1]|nr:hypothetical protein E4V01_24215 [Methylorubrum sp. Q1]
MYEPLVVERQPSAVERLAEDVPIGLGEEWHQIEVRTLGTSELDTLGARDDGQPLLQSGRGRTHSRARHEECPHTRKGLAATAGSPDPSGYYTEWVHPTPGLNGAGPQRIVSGNGRELFYTPDHYTTFIRLSP